MAAYYPVPVTGENESEVWTWVDHWRIQARKNRVVCTACTWLGGLLFLILSWLVLATTLIHYEIRPFRTLFSFLPGASTILDPFVTYLPRLNKGFFFDLLFGLILATLVSCLIMVIFEILISLLYHPKKRLIPEGSPKERASALLANGREAMETGVKIRPYGWLVPVVSFFLVEFGLLTACILLVGDPAELFARYLTASTALNYLLVFLLSTGLFTMLWGTQVVALWVFCRMKLPYSFVAELECYSFFAGEKAGKKTRQEILEERKVKAAKQREDALALERSGAYPKATALLLEAAHGGDVSAMEHYARHCLISDSRIPAEYWLKKCIATGQASKNAKKLLRKLRSGRSTGAAFIRE